MSADEGNGLGAERLAELRAVAEKATPGPWEMAGAIGGGRVNGPRGRWVAGHYEAPGARSDARHIATFDPPTVLALLDAIDRLTRERDEAREALAHPQFIVAGIDQDPEVMAKVMREWRPMLTVPEDDGLREGVERVRALMANARKHAGGSWTAVVDVLSLERALDPERASGRDQVARPSSTPKRPSEHPTSADEGPHFDDAAWIRDRLEPARSVEWTFDSPAVRPSNDDEEELGA